jgi:hypothetical protein
MIWTLFFSQNKKFIQTSRFSQLKIEWMSLYIAHLFFLKICGVRVSRGRSELIAAESEMERERDGLRA